MPKKYELFYTGTGRWQARSIERAGFVFIRGCSTEVSREVYNELKDEEGFEVSKPSSSSDKED